VERRSASRAIGTSERRLLETISFFSEPTYALDREGKVIAWDQAIAGFTGVEPKDEEFLFIRAELLKRTGILRGQENAIADAVRTYNRILEVNTKNADAWNGLGVCMKEKGKDEMSR
jgi:PAS domain-containing protein